MQTGGQTPFPGTVNASCVQPTRHVMPSSNVMDICVRYFQALEHLNRCILVFEGHEGHRLVCFDISRASMNKKS